MTRTLTQKLNNDDLNDDDLLQAMEFIRRYVVVGLANEMEKSIQKFLEHFGWLHLLDDNKNKCLQHLANRVNIGPYGFHKGSLEWNWIHTVNRYDYQLYLYAQYLFTR
eukprot:CAMPEP_0197839528 /NCGR_PEP_ID=MMETSP1437-20131217/43348_1 /TAXON_ID=49252 ORGANISM="Eucampia antarctica, Strain CCMP1452" /NCGR_SAMPLE_ID=MMETSP1437 /ASSEMBLY_ACC=CAM_ASM_001096 /LENGTH=107 /DNA_ID=CAMNT_0043448681 /DNA_START=17 /DNA_END=336 /DNA_ORIENTATION=+